MNVLKASTVAQEGNRPIGRLAIRIAPQRPHHPRALRKDEESPAQVNLERRKISGGKLTPVFARAHVLNSPAGVSLLFLFQFS